MATAFQSSSPPHRNKLLAHLGPADLARLEPHLQLVTLVSQQRLYDYREHITHIYFPLSGVVALMRSLSDGETAQVASVGSEGVVGYGALINGPIAMGHAVVQLPGEALRVETPVIQNYALEHPRFRAVTMHYGHVLISHLMQSVVCQRFHSTQQRYALWLLQTQDRAHSDIFPLTQETVAQSLGVRRATVSEVSRVTRQTGAVAYRRGLIEVRDRASLLSQACECYAMGLEEYERLFDIPEFKA